MNYCANRIQSSHDLIERSSDRKFADSITPRDTDYDHNSVGMTEESEDENDNQFDSYGELAQKRAHLDSKLKAKFESIFEKYGKDFDGIGDEIDIATGEIVVNNGHVQQMQDERDAGDNNYLRMDQNGLLNEHLGCPNTFLEDKDSPCHGDKFNQANGSRNIDGDKAITNDDREEDDLILRGLARANQYTHLSSEEIFQSLPEDPFDFATGTSTLLTTIPSRASIFANSFPQIKPSNVNFSPRYYSQHKSYIGSCWQTPNLPVFSREIDIEPAWRIPEFPKLPTSKSITSSTLNFRRSFSPDATGSLWAPARQGKRKNLPKDKELIAATKKLSTLKKSVKVPQPPLADLQNSDICEEPCVEILSSTQSAKQSSEPHMLAIENKFSMMNSRHRSESLPSCRLPGLKHGVKPKKDSGNTSSIGETYTSSTYRPDLPTPTQAVLRKQMKQDYSCNREDSSWLKTTLPQQTRLVREDSDNLHDIQGFPDSKLHDSNYSRKKLNESSTGWPRQKDQLEISRPKNSGKTYWSRKNTERPSSTKLNADYLLTPHRNNSILKHTPLVQDDNLLSPYQLNNSSNSRGKTEVRNLKSDQENHKASDPYRSTENSVSITPTQEESTSFFQNINYSTSFFPTPDSSLAGSSRRLVRRDSLIIESDDHSNDSSCGAPTRKFSDLVNTSQAFSSCTTVARTKLSKAISNFDNPILNIDKTQNTTNIFRQKNEQSRNTSSAGQGSKFLTPNTINTPNIEDLKIQHQSFNITNLTIKPSKQPKIIDIHQSPLKLNTDSSLKTQPSSQGLKPHSTRTTSPCTQNLSLNSAAKSSFSKVVSKFSSKSEELDELSLCQNEILLISSEPKPNLSAMIRRKKLQAENNSSPRFPFSTKCKKRKLITMGGEDDIDELGIDLVNYFP